MTNVVEKEIYSDRYVDCTEGGMMELGELGRKWGIEERKIKSGLNVVGSINDGNM